MNHSVASLRQTVRSDPGIGVRSDPGIGGRFHRNTQTHRGAKTRKGVPTGRAILSSKYTDDETGLLYYGYRYYHPEQGRFISRDPGAAERNLYFFLANTPLNDVDALGMSSRQARQGQVKFYTLNQWSPNPSANDIWSVEVQSEGDVRVFINPSRSGCAFLDWRAIPIGIFGGWFGSSFTISEIWILVWIECGPMRETGQKCDQVGYRKHDETDGKIDYLGKMVLVPPNMARPELACYVAHERGHAKGFIEKGRDVARISLSPYIGMTTQNTGFIQWAWSQARVSGAAANWRNASDHYANEETVKWFDNSPQWQRIQKQGAGLYWERQ